MLESRVVPHAAKKRTTIGIKKATKAKLDADRAPGQCYDGFLSQLLEFWETQHSRLSKQGPAGGNQGA
jgi:hypothetical protein